MKRKGSKLMKRLGLRIFEDKGDVVWFWAILIAISMH